MLSAIASKWWVLLLRGICAVIAGILAIAWPGITILTLVIFYGAFAITDGIASIWLGFKGNAGSHWWEMILLGIIAIAAGVMAFVWPQITALVLVTIVGAAAIARGIFEIVAAIKLRKVIDDEWLLILSGVMSVIFGGLILFRPLEGAVVIGILIGAYMLAFGAMTIAFSLRLRQFYHKLHHA